MNITPLPIHRLERTRIAASLEDRLGRGIFCAHILERRGAHDDNASCQNGCAPQKVNIT